MLTSKGSAEWIDSFNPDPAYTVMRGPEVKEFPDKLVVVTVNGGPGLLLEGLFDAVELQVRIRGAQNDFDGVETYALNLDKLIVFQGMPVVTDDGVYITSITRTGSRPKPMGDLDNGRRLTLVCNYIAQVATDA